MANNSTVNYVKGMLVDYYDQTKDQDIHQESPSAQKLYKDLLLFFDQDDVSNGVFAKSNIISKTARHYRQHFWDRVAKKDKDRANKPMTSRQLYQVKKALQLHPQRQKP